MSTWEVPTEEKEPKAEETAWAGRSQKGAQDQPTDGNKRQGAGGKMTISPPANVKLPTPAEIQRLYYGVDTLVVAIDIN